VFGAGNLVHQGISNIPKAIKLLSDALIIINPLIKNELLVVTFFYRYISKIKSLAYFGYGTKIQGL
jgi:squalene monooxygenase